MKFQIRLYTIACLLVIATVNNVLAQDKILLKEDFNKAGSSFNKIGKGECYVENNTLISKDAYYQKETDRCENYTFDYKKTKISWFRQWIELPEGINNKAEKPLVYKGLIQVVKNSALESLSSGCEHRYARIKDRRKEMLTMKGFPIISIENGGEVILSEMMTSKGVYDPIAAKLLTNMINKLIE